MPRAKWVRLTPETEPPEKMRVPLTVYADKTPYLAKWILSLPFRGINDNICGRLEAMLRAEAAGTPPSVTPPEPAQSASAHKPSGRRMDEKTRQALRDQQEAFG